MSNEKKPNCFGVYRGLCYPVMSVPGLHVRLLICTLPETNSLSHLKMDGWNVGMLVSLWDGLFSGPMLVSGRV